jgi:peroxiredoxin
MVHLDRSAPMVGATLERRLLGAALPDRGLECAQDAFVSLAASARESALAIFFYRGVADGSPEMDDEDEARAIEWADHLPGLHRLGYSVLGVSVQTISAHAKVAGGEPFRLLLLSDPDLQLAELLKLPTREEEWGRVYEPLTILVRGERISRIFYPVDSAQDAASVVEWIKRETQP